MVRHHFTYHRFFYVLLLVLTGAHCASKKEQAPAVFEVQTSAKTGLHFSNKLTATPEFNMFKYMYFYNGAGVGAGDFNNDGLIDLFFSANQGDNKLFLNKGGLQFTDATAAAAVPQDGGWSTGVSVVDINNDGLLDIYVCKVGQFETLKGKNQLLVCQRIDKNGVPVYADKAKEYGLDFSGFSTQAAFLDYDMDGDLDLFLLNHSVHQNGTFAARKMFIGTSHPLTGDRIYRNDGDTFTDVSAATGINRSAIGYGLGVAVADINVDGYPDLYIGNDFHENDYLYINQRNGTFKEDLTACMMQTSQFSMGVDVADINNDAWPEIISVDMLPSDPYILKRSLGEDEYNLFNMKVAYGYTHQYARNTLQLARGNGQYSEVGRYAGVFATDWSWAPLWMDFDNDGLKDLFVSNGIPKRLNDMDYVNYVSNDEVQNKINANLVDEKEMAVIDQFPQIKLKNKFFKNNGQATFTDLESGIKGDVPTFSNGAVYADFDKDGDLDVVVNNIDEEVLLYQNKSNDAQNKAYLSLQLKGAATNPFAVGAKAIVFAGTELRTYEQYPVRGFQSSMQVPLHIGLNHTTADSILVIWPDNTYQKIQPQHNRSILEITYQQGLPLFDYTTLTDRLKSSVLPMADVTKKVGLLHGHEENPFVEFDREPLIPHMVSRDDPALAVGDANGDGLEDVFIGSSKGKKSTVLRQTTKGTFERLPQPALDNDSTYEDVDACWIDVNNDTYTDLVVASGGNEYYGKDEYLTPRVYLNDGQTNFKKLPGAFAGLYLTASSVVPYDFSGDGFTDLFIGARAVPWEYGQVPQSYLLENDRTGRFKDVTAQYSKDLAKAGFVKSAVWSDLEKDGDMDLILSLEWDGICAFINQKGRFTKKQLTDKKGWWNFTLPVDVDGDGDLDLIAGNLGQNNRLKATEKEPVKLYYNDFDGNGKKEQVLTYYLQGREIPFANKDELQKQIPLLKKRFLYAEDFARATLGDLFSNDKLREADVLTANYFSNAVFINDGNLNFTVKPLPWLAQLSTYNDAVMVNANNDALPDILLAGNFYNNNIQMGRYDADLGTVLVNKGGGHFAPQNTNGLIIKGQVRHIKKISIAQQDAFILVRNNDSTMVVQFKQPQ